MLIECFDLGFPLPGRLIQNLRDQAIDYFDILKRDGFSHSWFNLRDNPEFSLLEARSVPYHSDYASHLNVNAYRIFLILKNPYDNWKLKDSTQEVSAPTVGKICILNVGKEHGVIGLNKHRAPLITLSWSPDRNTNPIDPSRWENAIQMKSECVEKFAQYLNQCY